MPTPRQNCGETLANFDQRAPSLDFEGLGEAYRSCLIGVTPNGAATFFLASSGVLSLSWRRWIDQLFSPILRPHFQSAWNLASEGRSIELGEIDRALDRELPRPVAARGRDAAEPFFEGKTERKADRGWERFANEKSEGALPGQITTVFAAHAASHQVALRSALLAYAWFEFRQGQSQISDPTHEIFQTVIPKLRTEDRNCASKNDGCDSPLRVV
ncbi:MAG: hypothetical protein AAF236_10675 [Verrucomicrobiota bacterium]